MFAFFLILKFLQFIRTILFLIILIVVFIPQTAYCSDAVSLPDLVNFLQKPSEVLYNNYKLLFIVLLTITSAIRILFKDSKTIISCISEWIVLHARPQIDNVPGNGDEKIDRKLNSQAFQYYSCFISHSTIDKKFLDRIYADLRKKGVRCWFAPEDMKIGDKIRQRIDQSIKTHDKFLLILSENSIHSEWVEDECETAYTEERKRGNNVLFPIRIDDAVMDTNKAWAAKLKQSRNIGDFTQWQSHNAYEKAFDRLLEDLKIEDSQAPNR